MYFNMALFEMYWISKFREFNWISVRVQTHTSPADKPRGGGKPWGILSWGILSFSARGKWVSEQLDFPPLEATPLSKRRWHSEHRIQVSLHTLGVEQIWKTLFLYFYSDVKKSNEKRETVWEKRLSGWLCIANDLSVAEKWLIYQRELSLYQSIFWKSRRRGVTVANVRSFYHKWLLLHADLEI